MENLDLILPYLKIREIIISLDSLSSEIHKDLKNPRKWLLVRHLYFDNWKILEYVSTKIYKINTLYINLLKINKNFNDHKFNSIGYLRSIISKIPELTLDLDYFEGFNDNLKNLFYYDLDFGNVKKLTVLNYYNPELENEDIQICRSENTEQLIGDDYGSYLINKIFDNSQKITEFNVYESCNLKKINSKMSLCIEEYHTLQKIYIEGMIVHISNLKGLKELKLVKCMGTDKIADFNIGKIEKCPNLEVMVITHNMSNYVIKDTEIKTLKLILSDTDDVTEPEVVDNLFDDLFTDNNDVYIFDPVNYQGVQNLELIYESNIDYTTIDDISDTIQELQNLQNIIISVAYNFDTLTYILDNLPQDKNIKFNNSADKEMDLQTLTSEGFRILKKKYPRVIFE